MGDKIFRACLNPLDGYILFDEAGKIIERKKVDEDHDIYEKELYIYLESQVKPLGS